MAGKKVRVGAFSVAAFRKTSKDGKLVEIPRTETWQIDDVVRCVLSPEVLGSGIVVGGWDKEQLPGYGGGTAMVNFSTGHVAISTKFLEKLGTLGVDWEIVNDRIEEENHG
jgi:hypothetical protein